MQDVEYWIEHFDLQPHPEGGYFRETYRATEKIPGQCLPPRFNEDRAFGTGIYFLLPGSHFSAFHRMKSDEVWHFYIGDPITLYVITREGEYYKQTLGLDIKTPLFQATVPAGAWLAAEVEGEKRFTLTGCTVAPGFEFQDFELADRESLQSQYPQHHDIIERFTRSEF
ncbi:MAG: cupin domain-containing protein [Verrucomicrobiota bacterium]